MELTLESLGLTQEELAERVVEGAVEALLRHTYADENGNPEEVETRLSKQVMSEVKQRLDEAVCKIGDEHIMPKFVARLESLEFQNTNHYGEPKGEAKTFLEYLTERCDAYVSEPVDHSGRTAHEGAYNWQRSGPRIAVMVDNYIDIHIQDVLKKKLKTFNADLAKGVAGELERQIKTTLDKLQAQQK